MDCHGTTRSEPSEFGLVGSKSAKAFERLPSKVKAAFTRHFNKTGRVTQGMLTNMKQADVDKLLVKKRRVGEAQFIKQRQEEEGKEDVKWTAIAFALSGHTFDRFALLE